MTPVSGEYAVEVDAGEPAAEWEELAERVGAPPFRHPGWIRAWSRAFGSGRPELHVLRRSGRVAALLPLERTTRGRTSPTNSETPDFGLLALDRDAARALAAGVLGRDDLRL